MKQFDIVGFGALNVDSIHKISKPHFGKEAIIKETSLHAGGSAGNTVCALSKIGFHCGAVGKIGGDSRAKILLTSFEQNGVDTSHIIKDSSSSTGLSHSFVDSVGNRTIFSKSEANQNLHTKNINLKYIKSAEWVHLSNFIDEEQNALQLALGREINRSANTSLWVDNNIFDYGYTKLKKILPYIHTFFIKEELAIQLLNLNSRDAALKLIDDGCKEVVFINNPYESEVFTEYESYHIQTRHTSIIDATGITGAYVAGYLYGKIRGFHLRRSALLGNVMMSFCGEKVGCRSNLPTLKELIQRTYMFKPEKNVLIVGSGGREHALAWKLNQSHKVHRLYVAPGNAGISEIAQTVPISANDICKLKKFVKDNDIDVTIVGPEVPLSKGIADEFEADGLALFGPSKKAALIESSKIFGKEFMKKFNIPSASYEKFSSYKKAISYLRIVNYPIVVKADGLAAGKGVYICHDIDQAKKALEDVMVKKMFGDAGKQIIIEEYLVGQEASILVFTDGIHIVPLLPAQDHKAIFDNDQGPNTGGMGAYAPATIVTPKVFEIVMKTILEPTIAGMKQIGRKYKGVLFVGLILTKSGPRVLEYNCRLGDPETQAILPLLKSDLMDIIEGVLMESLDTVDVSWHKKFCNCVVLASNGYPSEYSSGKEITFNNSFQDADRTHVFHSGSQTKIITSGGRVLGVFSTGDSLKEAIQKSYKHVEKIHFEKMHYRRDIGKKGLKIPKN